MRSDATPPGEVFGAGAEGTAVVLVVEGEATVVTDPALVVARAAESDDPVSGSPRSRARRSSECRRGARRSDRRRCGGGLTVALGLDGPAGVAGRRGVHQAGTLVVAGPGYGSSESYQGQRQAQHRPPIGTTRRDAPADPPTAHEHTIGRVHACRGFRVPGTASRVRSRQRTCRLINGARVPLAIAEPDWVRRSTRTRREQQCLITWPDADAGLRAFLRS